MKNFKIKLICVLIFIFIKSNIYPQTLPAYYLEAWMFQPDEYYITNYVTFEIKLVWINHNEVSQFEFAGGQYFFTFNTNIANGGVLSYTYDTAGMSTGFGGRYDQVLRPDLRPRNPQISGNQLRLAANIFPGAGNGQLITNTIPNECLIIKMKISTTSAEFTHQQLNIKWANNPVVPFPTKIFAYVGTTNTDITDTINHHLSYNPLLPVELADFLSSTNKNSVTLKWETSTEKNNHGFEIERTDMTSSGYKKIGFIEGRGNSDEPVSYSYTDRGLASGKYKYRLKQLDFNGHFEYYDLMNEVDIALPAQFGLSQNYPNPFNPAAKIDYELPRDALVRITVYDMTGREIRRLVNEIQLSGYHTVNFNADGLSSGVYFYKLETQEFSDVKRMMLIK